MQARSSIDTSIAHRIAAGMTATKYNSKHRIVDEDVRDAQRRAMRGRSPSPRRRRASCCKKCTAGATPQPCYRGAAISSKVGAMSQ